MRISTLGGECSATMAPFSYLINKYGDDMAILWIDSHPDMGTGETLDPQLNQDTLVPPGSRGRSRTAHRTTPRRPP